MVDRAKASVRLHGDISFSEGGSFYDVIYCMKHYGLAPQEAMPEPGTLQGDSLFNFEELSAVAGAVVEKLAKGKQKKLTPIWANNVSLIYDNYLGKLPEKFEYKGKTYTPIEFAQSLGLNPDDYVSLTSFTHHPFYEKFVVEVQDNWRWAQSYNLPLNEFMEVMDHAVRNGYTFAWGSDVSEKGFSSKTCVATIPLNDKDKDLSHSDAARWMGTDGKAESSVTAKGEKNHNPGNASGCLRQLGNHRRPRNGNLRTGQGQRRQGILHGKEFMGRLRQIQGHVLRLKTLRCLQNHKHSHPQGRPA